jgi:hypothetical protein
MRVLVSEEGAARRGHNRARGRVDSISIVTMTVVLVGDDGEGYLRGQQRQRYGSTECSIKAESGALEIYVGGFWKRIPQGSGEGSLETGGGRRSASCSTPVDTVKGRVGQWQWQCWGGRWFDKGGALLAPQAVMQAPVGSLGITAVTGGSMPDSATASSKPAIYSPWNWPS